MNASDIETGIVEYLKAKGLDFHLIQAGDDLEEFWGTSLAVAISSGVYDSGIGDNAEEEMTIALFVIVENKSYSDNSGRIEAHGLVQTVTRLLMGEDLDLDIDPLRPERYDDVSHMLKASAQASKMVFQLKFKTSYTLEKDPDDDTNYPSLEHIKLNFFTDSTKRVESNLHKVNT